MVLMQPVVTGRADGAAPAPLTTEADAADPHGLVLAWADLRDLVVGAGSIAGSRYAGAVIHDLPRGLVVTNTGATTSPGSLTLRVSWDPTLFSLGVAEPPVGDGVTGLLLEPLGPGESRTYALQYYVRQLQPLVVGTGASTEIAAVVLGDEPVTTRPVLELEDVAMVPAPRSGSGQSATP